jgi:hypothetical protein
MIPHRTLTELAALDELETRRRDRVRRHLARCQRCRDDLRFVRELKATTREVVSPAPQPDGFTAIRARREAGERVILPANVSSGGHRRRIALRLAVASSTIAAVAIAAQFAIRQTRSPEPRPAPNPPAAPTEAPVGIAIVPAGPTADIRLEGTGPIRLEVSLHDGSELGVRGRGAAESARFRTAGGGIQVSDITGGVLELRIPRNLTTRLYLNGRLEITADGRSLRAERTGKVGERISVDLGR